jgi:hypothetical protein
MLKKISFTFALLIIAGSYFVAFAHKSVAVLTPHVETTYYNVKDFNEANRRLAKTLKQKTESTVPTRIKNVAKADSVSDETLTELQSNSLPATSSPDTDTGSTEPHEDIPSTDSGVHLTHTPRAVITEAPKAVVPPDPEPLRTEEPSIVSTDTEPAKILEMEQRIEQILAFDDITGDDRHLIAELRKQIKRLESSRDRN